MGAFWGEALALPWGSRTFSLEHWSKQTPGQGAEACTNLLGAVMPQAGVCSDSSAESWLLSEGVSSVCCELHSLPGLEGSCGQALPKR